MWKQPIPTKIEGLSPQEQTVFQLILLRCSNKKQFISIGGAYIELDKGQCIYGRYEFAEKMCLKRSESMRVQRIVDRLSKSSKLISKRKSRNCTVITVNNYDEIMAFEQTDEQSVSNQRAISEQSVSTNKSVESVKSEKIYIPPKKTSKKKKTEKVKYDYEYLKSQKGKDALRDKFSEYYIEDELDKMIDWIESKGKQKAYKDFLAFGRNWMRRVIDDGKLLPNEKETGYWGN